MQQVTDLERRTFPFKSICLLRMNFPNSPSNFLHWGTGSLVESKTILTAGHNIYDSIYKQAESIDVQVGRDLLTVRNHRNSLYTPKEWRAFADQKQNIFSPFDYGTIRLPVNYGDVLGNFILDPGPVGVANVTVAGFHYVNRKLLKGNGRVLSTKTPEYRLNYGVNTVPGVSGGPIFYQDPRTKLYAQIGIHSAETESQAYGIGVKTTWCIRDLAKTMNRS